MKMLRQLLLKSFKMVSENSMPRLNTIIGHNGEVYLAADNHPMTKFQILNVMSQNMDLCDNDQQENDKKGKVCDSTWTRQRVGWTPRYANFLEYVKLKQRTN